MYIISLWFAQEMCEVGRAKMKKQAQTGTALSEVKKLHFSPSFFYFRFKALSAKSCL